MSRRSGGFHILAASAAALLAPAVQALAGREADLLVVSEDGAPVDGCAAAARADLHSADALATALAPCRGRIRQILLAEDDVWPYVAAACGRLHHPAMDAQLACRVKPVMRAKLRKELSTPWALIEADATDERLALALAELPPQLVLKPLWGTGSRYVTRAEGRADALMACRRMFAEMAGDPALGPATLGGRAWNPRRQILIEGFIDGDEFSIEGYIAGGTVQVLLIQEKLRWRTDVALPFETLNLAPTPNLSSEEYQRLERATAAALFDLGLDNTFFHVEVKQDAGRVGIVEINPRLGGGSVPAMLDDWFGTDVRPLALRLGLGEAPPLFGPGREGFLAGVFVNAREAGVFSHLKGVEWCRARPQFAFETFYRRRGETIPPPGTGGLDRPGWMYLYDVFYRCRSVDEVDDLYDGTLAAVQAVMR